MKISACILALLMLPLAACNLEATPTPPNTIGTATPVQVGSELRIDADPAAPITEDGVVLSGGAVVTIIWDTAPEGALVTFTLSNTLVDGGMSIIADNITADANGAQASFRVPDSLIGEISASAVLPNQQEIIAQTLPLRVYTANVSTGACRYLPAALGPGETLFAEPDSASAALATVAFDQEYVVLRVSTNGAVRFYEIEHAALNQRGWVLASSGGTLIGDCSAFE